MQSTPDSKNTFAVPIKAPFPTYTAPEVPVAAPGTMA
jgi:hypothetical protein